MRKILALLSFVLLLIQYQAVEFVVNHKLFYNSEGKSILELYVTIPALNSQGNINQKFIQKGEKLHSSFEVTRIISKGENIIEADKYVVNSPNYKDSTVTDLLDLQRVILPFGTYNVEISIKDLNDTLSSSKVDFPLVSIQPSSKIYASDALFVDNLIKTKKNNKYSRGGYDIYPLTGDFLSQDINKLAIYFELYGLEGFDTLSNEYAYFLNLYESGKENKFEKYAKFKKIQGKPINAFIEVIDISDLKTGNYDLVLDVYDRNQKVVFSKKYFFQRVNEFEATTIANIDDAVVSTSFAAKINSLDSVHFFVKSLYPIATVFEKDQISKYRNSCKSYMKEFKKSNDLRMAKRSKDNEGKEIEISDKQKAEADKLIKEGQLYIYKFWYGRYQHLAESEWRKYKKEVNQVQYNFATNYQEGFETDRGRVWLQYGKPNEIIDRPNDDGSYPYQIWYYRAIRQFRNQKFLFYDPTLGNTNYELLNSTLNGEIRNYKWEDFLKFRSNPAFQNIDSESESRSTVNDRARELWNRPGGY